MSDDSSRPFAIRRLLPLALLVLAGVLFVILGGGRYLTFSALADNHEWLCKVVSNAGIKAVLAFIASYAGLVALSVPGAALCTIAAGFLFGPWLGTGYALVGATLGATIVFLAARAGLAGLLTKAGPWVRRFEAGFRDDALSYLLVLRLIPVFPFWLVNLAAGVIGVPLWTYLLATLIGMIPGTFVYASLGNGLGALIEEGRQPGLSVLLNPAVFLPILGLAALALLPVAFKRWRARNGPEAA